MLVLPKSKTIPDIALSADLSYSFPPTAITGLYGGRDLQSNIESGSPELSSL